MTYITNLGLIVCLAVSPISLGENRQQTPLVAISFEIDGRPAVAPSVIEFKALDGKKFGGSKIEKGQFSVPPSIRDGPVDVVLRLKTRVLIFRGVYPGKFQGTWKVGVDTPPFSSENLASVSAGSKPKEIWFIDFHPLQGDATRVVVAVPARF